MNTYKENMDILLLTHAKSFAAKTKLEDADLSRVKLVMDLCSCHMKKESIEAFNKAVEHKTYAVIRSILASECDKLVHMKNKTYAQKAIINILSPIVGDCGDALMFFDTCGTIAAQPRRV
jgi:hypothetical protein